MVLFFALILAILPVAGVVLIAQPMPWVSKGKPVPEVYPAELAAHVRILSEDFHPRCYDHPENLEKAANYIERHFVSAGGEVFRQTFPNDERHYSNIIGSFGPSPGPVVIVGAHYDSYGENYFAETMYTPGADDNASGVAGLLALASLFAETPPPGRVLLVAYCLEEPPFFATQGMGSFFHAKSLREEGVEVSAMISLEMLGCFSDAEGSQSYPASAMEWLYPTQGNFIGVVGRFEDIPLTRKVKSAMLGVSDLPVYSINALTLIPGIDFSDHRNFWRFGYQPVMVTDTAFYRNTAYHAPADTPASLDYVRMSKAVQGVYAAVLALTRENAKQ